MRIAIATCKRLPEADHDEKPLLDELRRLGAEPAMLPWDGGGAADGYDLCVIRSTWNYIHDLPGFLAWTKDAARRTTLRNPASVVKWNSDKRYLGELARRGVPAVPTVFHPRGGERRLARSIAGRGWTELVIKPRVGAASFMTRRFPLSKLGQAEEFLREAARERDMMIQPYVASVETRGERSLVWIDGRFTHAVRKSPRLADDEESVRPVRIADDERRFAARALAGLGPGLLYARVDVARGDDGSPMLMELELIEPSLFLVHSKAALRRLARACVRPVRARASSGRT